MDLNRDAMLVGLRITAWSGRLYDREGATTSPRPAPGATTSACCPRPPSPRSLRP